MKKFFLSFAMMLALGVTMIPSNKAHADDFIDLDLTAVAPGLRGAFLSAEAFWESRINGYRADLPAAVRAQLGDGRISIDAQTAFLDGAGGLLGQAGPTDFAQSFNVVGNPANGRVNLTTVATAGFMQFDIADAGNADQFADTVLHEMAHVLGIGTLWELNGIVGPAGSGEQGLLQTRNGLLQYIGSNGLRGFREQSGHHRANYVPTENFGGPGTALGHWAGGTSPNWFFAPANGSRVELMTGFATAAPTFIAEATWGALADTGWSVDGINAGLGAVATTPLGSPRFPKSGRGGPFFARTDGNSSISAVPEPSSAIVLIAGLAGMLVRRRRTA